MALGFKLSVSQKYAVVRTPSHLASPTLLPHTLRHCLARNQSPVLLSLILFASKHAFEVSFFSFFFFFSGTKISAETDHGLPKYTSLCLIPLLGMACRLLFPCRRVLLSLHSQALRVWRRSPVVA